MLCSGFVAQFYCRKYKWRERRRKNKNEFQWTKWENLEKQFYDVYLDEKFCQICARLTSRRRTHTHTCHMSILPFTGNRAIQLVAPSKASLPSAANKIWIQNSNSFVCKLSTDILFLRCDNHRQKNPRSSQYREAGTAHAALCVKPCEKRKRIWIGIIYYYYIISLFCCRACVLSARWAVRHRISSPTVISHIRVLCGWCLCCIERRRAYRHWMVRFFSVGAKTTAQCFGIVSRK